MKARVATEPAPWPILQIVEKLEAVLGPVVSYDFPGVIAIAMGNGATWVFGTATDTWAGDYFPTPGAYNDQDPDHSVTTTVLSDSGDVDAVAQAILKAMQR